MSEHYTVTYKSDLMVGKRSLNNMKEVERYVQGITDSEVTSVRVFVNGALKRVFKVEIDDDACGEVAK